MNLRTIFPFKSILFYDLMISQTLQKTLFLPFYGMNICNFCLILSSNENTFLWLCKFAKWPWINHWKSLLYTTTNLATAFHRILFRVWNYRVCGSLGRKIFPKSNFQICSCKISSFSVSTANSNKQDQPTIPFVDLMDIVQ